MVLDLQKVISYHLLLFMSCRIYAHTVNPRLSATAIIQNSIFLMRRSFKNERFQIKNWGTIDIGICFKDDRSGALGCGTCAIGVYKKS